MNFVRMNKVIVPPHYSPSGRPASPAPAAASKLQACLSAPMTSESRSIRRTAGLQTGCPEGLQALRPPAVRRHKLTAALTIAISALPISAQYVGQVTKKSTDTPELRAVGVLEWTGDPGKPKTSRLVPITIYDGDQLQDAGVYLARPQPLALDPEVEYQLKRDGKTIGLFDIQNASQVQGSWLGFGDWKPLPKPKAEMRPQKVDEDDDWNSDDKPVLHRRKKDSGPQNGGSSGSGSGNNAPAPDPDRPTLHRPTGDTSGNSQPSSTQTQTDSAGSAPVDPDRPVMKQPEPPKPAAPANETASVSSLPDISDPDRPRLVRGKSEDSGPRVTPTLIGLPPDMEQTVAVSDARNTPDHPWVFTWADPSDELKMKAQMEDIARQALGLTPPPAPAPAKTTRRSAKKAATPATPPEPPALADEQFRVFELAYGSGATGVLTASTGGPLDKEKFVTLIAQPDLYGNVLVLLKNVADGSDLDDTPRMRLVDAVDAMADNRGELLFELRGATQRQFALYRVLRGQVTRLFTTAADPIATAGSGE